MPNAIFMIGADVPIGYEAVAYRQADIGEFILDESSDAVIGPLPHSTACRQLIVRKIERWRPATVNDLLRGRIRARFRISKESPWNEGILCGYRVTAKK